MSAAFILNSHGLTHGGFARQRNNDAFVADDRLGLYVVSDGMGGQAAGGEAAQLTVTTVRDILRRQRSLLEAVGVGDTGPEALELLLQHALLEACAAVYNRACAAQGSAGMGATVSAVVIAGGHAVLAHVGNCRIYLLRQQKLEQLTRDHTLTAEHRRARGPAASQAPNSSQALSRVIGLQPSVGVDTLVMEVLPADRLLLCTDGYTRYLRDSRALGKQLATGSAATVATKLVEAAKLAGGEDNITCVVVSLADEQADPARNSAVIERYAALGQVFLFQDLGLPLLARVVSHSRRPRHQAGEVVVKAGEVCDQLMVVLAGEYILTRADVEVGRLSGGEHLGVTLLFHPRPARSTLRALTAGQLLVLPAEALQRLLRQRPWLGMGLLQRLGERISADLERSYHQREGSQQHREDSEQF